MPYFWSEQFGRFVQYAGHHAAADELLWRGDPDSAAWTVCWLRSGVLVACSRWDGPAIWPRAAS
ncbi:oxidoreductase C-terminal domain-containing protein [Streptomyces orinoci]|uniref:oxidoreductase C-terminal domain-containing protein n=1 Tax=Streptomyces orinoci TaxID=67339 RepID=UPI001F4F0D71|nr:oxidoreductase C-terminal domain-containing protein [Streptomyces orinoci]